MPTNASQVIYTGLALSYIGVTPNQTLDTILDEINTAFNSVLPAPDYSSYNLGPYHGYSITQTDGTSHPTNTQNFAEGIAKIVCTDEYNLSNFIGVTYAADLSATGAAISALQTPALTYSVTAGGSSIVITSGMTRNQVLTATYTGVGSILNLLNVPGNVWSSLSISDPDNILDAFNALINYLSSLTTTVSGKQTAIGTFNATAIGGGATDSVTTTITELISYAAGLPTFATGGITWGCVASETDLQDTIQSIITSISAISTNYIIAAGTGLVATAISTCNGYSVGVDPAYTGYYKVMLSSGDTGSNAGFLDSKITSSDSSITFSIVGHQLDMVVASTPADGKIKVNGSDASPNYLEAKIPSSSGTWGLANVSSPINSNTQLSITPTVTDPVTLISNILSYISSDPALLAQFCSLQTQCAGCTCTAPSNLTVSLGMGTFILAWTVGGSPVSQMSEYRQRGYVDWITNVNISPANPEANDAVTSTVSNLDDNTVYQFQVESVCSGATNGSNVYESIRYSCQTLTAVVVGGVISVNQPILSTVDTIQYQLLNNSNVVVDTQTATGPAPNANFASQSAGTYHVNWRMGTLVNGVMLYSNDASQLNAMCTLAGVIIS